MDHNAFADIRTAVVTTVASVLREGPADPEAGHSLEDNVWERVLRAIADGALTREQAARLAGLALCTKAAPFPRWRG